MTKRHEPDQPGKPTNLRTSIFAALVHPRYQTPYDPAIEPDDPGDRYNRSTANEVFDYSRSVRCNINGGWD